MKKQTKSNLRASLLTLGIVSMVFFVMAFACDGDDEDTQTGGDGDLPQIYGTAWKIDPKIKNANVQTYLFCKSGRWQVISSQFLSHRDIPQHRMGGAVTFGGTYTINGNTLISRMVNEPVDDIYKMSWDGSRLKLADTKGGVLELYDPQPTECQ